MPVCARGPTTVTPTINLEIGPYLKYDLALRDVDVEDFSHAIYPHLPRGRGRVAKAVEPLYWSRRPVEMSGQWLLPGLPHATSASVLFGETPFGV